MLLAATTLLATNSGVQTAEAADTSHVPTPTIQGPILPSSGISYLGSTTFDPAVVGYEQSEFFLSGTATAYRSKEPLTKDGKWHVTPQTTAPYKTRVVVYRPIDPSKFDGTVVVEWLNVTGGIDTPAAWLNAHIQMIRQGMAFVGIDAQAGGLNGQAGSIAAKDGAGGIKQTDPARMDRCTTPATASRTASISRPARRCMLTGPRSSAAWSLST